MKRGKRHEAAAPRIESEVVRLVHQHARSCSKIEVCGVLIAREVDGLMTITASIPGVNATQGGTHVTFTQDTWEHIYRIKDRDYPDDRIIGWYHSHPGFGVFLSDHDTFIHKNFFSSPEQVAWVYDPQSDEEGCFGWVEGRIERLSSVVVLDRKGGEGAGETGKPEPAIIGVENDRDTSQTRGAEQGDAEDSLQRTVATVFSYITVLLLGVLVGWYVFPRVLVVPVDPRTGEVLSLPRNGDQSSGDQGRMQRGSTPQPSTEKAK